MVLSLIANRLSKGDKTRFGPVCFLHPSLKSKCIIENVFYYNTCVNYPLKLVLKGKKRQFLKFVHLLSKTQNILNSKTHCYPRVWNKGM